MNNIKNLIIRYRKGSKNESFFVIISIIFIIIAICVIGNIFYILFYGGEVYIRGCTSFRAENYNQRATVDNGTCIFTRESACNSNGNPDDNTRCGCDIGYAGRNCKVSMDKLYKNVVIESISTFINGIEYVVNSLSLVFNNEENILTNTITINDLELDKIYINVDMDNKPPTSLEYTTELPEEMHSTYFSIGTDAPTSYPNGVPVLPDLDQMIWIKPNVRFTRGIPIKMFQLTLKSDTNKGNILYEYADSSLREYMQVNLNIINGKIIIN